MSLTTRVLIGLVAGLAAGLAIAASGSPLLLRIPGIVEPIGILWVNAIRMTVIPLVVALLVVAIAAAPDVRTVGRIGRGALLLFLITLVAAGIFSVLVAPPIFDWIVDPAAAAAAQPASAEAAGDAARKVPSFRQWLVDLVPVNPVKAAADGAMLPLIVFTIAFGLALSRVDAERRAPLLVGFRALADAMLLLVRWVLLLAPIGFFALAVPLAARMGLAAAGALLAYVGVVSAMCIVFMLALYPAAVAFGRVSLRRFAQATAPAQAVAFSSRSSLASLPAMIEGARDRLGLPVEITGFFLPLSASVFRIGGVIGQTVGVVFLARLAGITLSPEQLATIGVTSVLTSFSVPGVPGGSIIVMIPVLLAAGLPIEGIGILLGVDTIPDMFRTTTNVTGHMAAATILGRDAPPDLATAPLHGQA